MALSTEVLNTTLRDLKDKQIMSFATATPFWEKLQKAARMESMDSGTYIERPFSGGPPGTARRLDVGDEAFSTTRKQNTKLIRVETTRIGGAISIPGKELDINDGKLGALKLIQRYPQTFLQSLAQDIESWWLIAQVQDSGFVVSNTEAQGWVTLNGDFSSGTGVGLTNGVLDFDTPANQATAGESVFDLAKATSYSHYNQYGAATSWAGDGEATIRDIYRRCTTFAPGTGGPDLIYMDPDTYRNWEMDRMSLVRINAVEDQTEKSTTLDIRLGKRAEVAYAYYLDRTASTFTAGTPGPDDGVVYLLNTDFWEL